MTTKPLPDPKTLSTSGLVVALIDWGARTVARAPDVFPSDREYLLWVKLVGEELDARVPQPKREHPNDEPWCG